MRSPDALAKRAHVGADTSRVHSVVTPTLAAGGAHVDAASLPVDDDPDDDIVGEAEPPALLTRFDATCIDIGCNDGPPGIDAATSRASLNAILTGNLVMIGTTLG
jgi:hypothetical protein